MEKCPSCGKEISTIYCHHCGRSPCPKCLNINYKIGIPCSSCGYKNKYPKTTQEDVLFAMKKEEVTREHYDAFRRVRSNADKIKDMRKDGNDLPHPIVGNMTNCPNCGTVSDSSYCPTCAQKENGESKMKRCPYCAEEIKNAAIYCRYCHRDLSPEILAPTPPRPSSQPNAYNIRKAKSYLSSSKTIWWIGGAFGFLYGLSIIYSLWGFSGAVISFFVGPITYALFPWYLGFVYGSWWLLLINYGTGITAMTLAAKAHKLDPSIE